MDRVWKHLCPQLFLDFGVFEAMERESQGIISILVALSKELQLKLEEEDFDELLAICTVKTSQRWKASENKRKRK